MQTVNFETTLGIIPVTGTAEAFGRSGAAVLAITGAFAKPDYMVQMPLLGEDRWDGLLARLPGNGTPDLTETSVEAFARAFDEVAEQLARPVVTCGVSVGALAALGMRRPIAHLALEPFLSTADLWPIWPGLYPGAGPPSEDMFLDAVFGLVLAGVKVRSYRPIFDRLTAPTEVLAGDIPRMPPRAWQGKMPSLLGEDDRAFLDAHPLVTLTVVPNAGHNLWWDNGRFVLARLNRLVEALRNGGGGDEQGVDLVGGQAKR